MASYNRDYEDLTSLDQDIIAVQEDINWDLRRKDLIEQQKKREEKNTNMIVDEDYDDDVEIIEPDDDVISHFNNRIGFRMNFITNNDNHNNNNHSLISDMDEQIARQMQEEADRDFARKLEKEERERNKRINQHHMMRNNIDNLINLNSINEPSTVTTTTRPARSTINVNTNTNNNNRRERNPIRVRNEAINHPFQNINFITNRHNRHYGPHVPISNDDFTPEDYDRLLQLDETTKKKGLEKNELSQLATFEFKISSDTSNVDSNDKTCSICYDDFNAKDKLTAIACLHKFHKKCIAPWLKDNRTCPLCKKDAITGK